MAAIGYAGVPNLDVAKIQVWLDDVQICKDGGAAADYTEAAGAGVMAQAEMTIRVDLGCRLSFIIQIVSKASVVGLFLYLMIFNDWSKMAFCQL